MRDTERKIAEEFGILERCESLEAQLLCLPECPDVEFDLSSLYDNMRYVILLVKYDIDVRREDYFAARKAFRLAAIRILLENDLLPSGDAIEDYGEHFYFVRRCGATWEIEQKKGESL